jgi:uncharacterized Zn-finger protein
MEQQALPVHYALPSNTLTDDLPVYQSSRDLRPSISRINNSSRPIKVENPHDRDEDTKPYWLRPAHRRAYSYEDVRAENRDERKKRGFTRPEDANCSCRKCGKLFQRSYNLKAHLETHDPHRSQPHMCTYPRCNKRFVRRTDLVRHEQSVSTPLISVLRSY